jgi:hypothetical protein
LKKKRVIMQHIKTVNEHSQLYYRLINLGLPGFSNREARCKVIWFKEESGGERGKAWIIYETTNELNEIIEKSKNAVQVDFTAVWLFEALPKIGPTHQTRATFTTVIDGKLELSSILMRQSIVASMHPIINLRRTLDKSTEVDMSKRKFWIEKFQALVPQGESEALQMRFADRKDAKKTSSGSDYSQTWIKSLGEGKIWGKT